MLNHLPAARGAALTPADLDTARLWAWMTPAQVIELCDVDRRTWRRWMNGQARIPRSVYELLRVRAGFFPAIAGDDWAGWKFHRGALCDPQGIEHTPGTITAWHYVRQHLEALQLAERLENVAALHNAAAIAAQLEQRLRMKKKAGD